MSVLIVSEEASATMYARRLARALSARGAKVFATSDLGRSSALPDGEDSGADGPPATDAPPVMTSDPAPLGAFGFVELAASLSAHVRKAREIASFLERERPSAVVTIDYGGFAMILARSLGARVPFHFFIPPKVWAWGAFRARMIARDFRRVFTIFPFENDAYLRAGANAEFVGHPLLELIEPWRREEKESALVALLPGSRAAEIAATLPPLAEAVDLMRAESPDLRFVLLVAERADRAPMEAAFAGRPVEFVAGEAERRRALARASLALCASGTAVLEAALLSTPAVALYRVNPLTALVARNLLRVRRVTLPNILLGEETVPELLQGDMNGPAVARAGLRLLRSGSLRRHVLDRFERLRGMLAGPGGSVFDTVASRVLGDGGGARA